MPSKFTFDRELLTRLFFFGAFAFLLTQVFYLAEPFLPSLLSAVILAFMFHPLHKRLRRRVKNPDLAALLMTSAIVLASIIPIVMSVWIIVRESTDLIPTVQHVLSHVNKGDVEVYRSKISPVLYQYIERIADFLSGINIDLKGLALDNARELATNISAVSAFIARNFLIMFFKFGILIVSLFFMLRDGQQLLGWIIGLVPMETSHKKDLTRSAYETFWAVSSGVFLTAMGQGVTAMIGFFLAGIRMPVLLGFFTAAASLLGLSFFVCAPVALFTMIENSGKGWFLLIWGLVVVGWLDNLLKPMLIGSRARMPFVLVFFSILGGVKMYGLVGILLGPILVACVLTFIRIYRETYDS